MDSVSKPVAQDTTQELDDTPEGVLNSIRDALETRGIFHMANGRDIGRLLDEARKENEQLNARLTCCCGDDIKHSPWVGHSPVSMYDHALDQANERIKELEAAHRVNQLTISTPHYVTNLALLQLWDLLGVSNQTEAVAALKALQAGPSKC